MSAPRLRDPVHLLAFGFGAGLSPRAPGTVGTLAAIPVYLLFAGQPLWLYSLIVVAAVGLWIALWAIPVEPLWIAAGFVAFRVFDIAKPWPISWLDENAKGGFGIMIDDVAAGLLACLALHVAITLGGA